MTIERVFWLKANGSVKEISEEHPEISRKTEDYGKFRNKYWRSGKALLLVSKNGDWFMWKSTPEKTNKFELKKSHLKQLKKLLRISRLE